MKIKRLIAREGLILIGIALLAFVLAATEPLVFHIFEEFFYFFIPSCLAYTSIRLIFFGIVKYDLKIKRIDRGGILVIIFYLLTSHFHKRVEHIQCNYTYIMDSFAMIFLLCASLYAIFFTIRFILWAVRTLREK